MGEAVPGKNGLSPITLLDGKSKGTFREYSSLRKAHTASTIHSRLKSSPLSAQRCVWKEGSECSTSAAVQGEMLCIWARDYGILGTGIDMSPLFTAQAEQRTEELGVAHQVTFMHNDAAGIMEFRKENGYFINGRHEECQLEATHLFPLLKSSDVANGRTTPNRYVLVTQGKPSDDTEAIQKRAPKTWTYLTAHASALDQRRSIIYQKRPRFSVFGVGDYSFAPWKVAVSGLYKNCRFEVVGQQHGKPIMLDDTCYFIPCSSEKEANFLCELLNSDVCQRFLKSLVFFDAKRPVTIDVLNRIDLKKVAAHVNRESEARRFLVGATGFGDRLPLLVFEKKAEYRTKGPSIRRVPRRR